MTELQAEHFVMSLDAPIQLAKIVETVQDGLGEHGQSLIDVGVGYGDPRGFIKAKYLVAGILHGLKKRQIRIVDSYDNGNQEPEFRMIRKEESYVEVEIPPHWLVKLVGTEKITQLLNPKLWQKSPEKYKIIEKFVVGIYKAYRDLDKNTN